MLDILRHILSNDHGEWQLLLAALSSLPFLRHLLHRHSQGRPMPLYPLSRTHVEIARTEFQNQTICLCIGHFFDGKCALLAETTDGQPYGRLSANFGGLGEDEVALRTWEEFNKPLLDAAINSGVLHGPVRHIPSGLVNAPVYKLISRPA